MCWNVRASKTVSMAVLSVIECSQLYFKNTGARTCHHKNRWILTFTIDKRKTILDFRCSMLYMWQFFLELCTAHRRIQSTGINELSSLFRRFAVLLLSENCMRLFCHSLRRHVSSACIASVAQNLCRLCICSDRIIKSYHCHYKLVRKRRMQQ